MCKCIYIHNCKYVYIPYFYIHIYMHINTFTYICTYICIYIHIHIYMWIYIYVYLDIYIYMYGYIHMYAHCKHIVSITPIHMYAYICMYPYIQSHEWVPTIGVHDSCMCVAGLRVTNAHCKHHPKGISVSIWVRTCVRAHTYIFIYYAHTSPFVVHLSHCLFENFSIPVYWLSCPPPSIHPLPSTPPLSWTRRNAPIYEAGADFLVGTDIKEPFVKHLLRETECIHAKARRFLLFWVFL